MCRSIAGCAHSAALPSALKHSQALRRSLPRVHGADDGRQVCGRRVCKRAAQRRIVREAEVCAAPVLGRAADRAGVSPFPVAQDSCGRARMRTCLLIPRLVPACRPQRAYLRNSMRTHAQTNKQKHEIPPSERTRASLFAFAHVSKNLRREYSNGSAGLHAGGGSALTIAGPAASSPSRNAARLCSSIRYWAVSTAQYSRGGSSVSTTEYRINLRV